MRFSALVVALCMAAVDLSVADEVNAAVTKPVDIPPESLSAALSQLAQQRGFQLIYVAEEVTGVQTNGAKGDLTPRQALDSLLTGTGFTFRFVNEQTVTIVPTSALESASDGSGTTGQSPDTPSPAVTGGSSADTSAAPADQSATAASGALQEVVVTAERRATDLQSTPIAITAIKGDQIASLHLNSIDTLQTVVPSLVDLNEGGQYELINIRGIGDSYVATNNVAGTAVTFDGAQITATLGVNPPMFDIADTEVLEGPQGTLFGASALAGAVETNSENPNFRGVNGYAQMDLGNYSDKHVQGAINLPVNDTFALRLAFNFEQQNSFYRDIGSGPSATYTNASGAEVANPSGGASGLLGYELDPGSNNDEAARLSFLWKPTDNFQALGKFTYNYINLGGLAAEPNNTGYNTLFSATATSNPTVYGGCTKQDASINYPGAVGQQQICPGAGTPTHYVYAYPGERPFTLDYYLGGGSPSYIQTQNTAVLELRYTLPDQIVLRSLTADTQVEAVRDNDISYGPYNAGWNHQVAGPHESYKQEEVDVISPTAGKVNWIVGGFFMYRETPIWTNNTSVTSPYQPYELPTTESFLELGGVLRSAAAFGQLNWQFTDTLQLQLGARQNWDSNFSTQRVAVAPAAGTTLSQPFGDGVWKINYPTGCSAATGTCVPTSYTVLSPIGQGGHYFFDRAPTGKADLNWTPIAGQNFYIFYARGYLSGSTNSGSTDHPLFQPEFLNDWEAGWKGRILGGHMLTQVGLYHYDLQNFQWTAFDPQATGDTSTGSYVANLGPTKMYGIEVSEQSRFAGLGVNLGFSYDRSKLGALTEVNSAELPPGWGSPLSVPQCLSGHTYGSGGCFNYSPYQQTVGGEQIPEDPLYTGNVAVDYLIHVGSGTIDPRVTYSYTASQYSDVFQDPYTYIGSRHLFGATLDWATGNWDTQLYGTNLANQVYIVSNQMNLLDWGAPRQFGIQERYTF